MTGQNGLAGGRMLMPTPQQKQAMQWVEMVMQGKVTVVSVLLEITRPPFTEQTAHMFMHLMQGAWLDNQLLLLRAQMKQAGVNKLGEGSKENKPNDSENGNAR